MGDLTGRQQKFVAEYICRPNATKAAIVAGYSAVNAGAKVHHRAGVKMHQ
jgi:phage terminase small subunit